MKALETKDLKFTLVSLDDEKGTFTGYASVFGVVDAYRDIVDKGAFRKSLRDKKEFPILWSHRIVEPIGTAVLKEDDTGLRVEAGKLNLDVQRAREVWSLMKQGAIEGISICYQTIDAKPDRDDPQTRHLKEVKLWEISPCVFPACEDAIISEVKTTVGMAGDDILATIISWKTKSPVFTDGQRKLAREALASLEALSVEPPQGTPAEEPPDIEGKPEDLHLLTELNSELTKLNETLRRTN